MKTHLILIPLSVVLCHAQDFTVTLSQNSPIVIGGTVTLIAQIFKPDGSQPTGGYSFSWKDDAMPAHTQDFSGEMTKCLWNITYPSSVYPPGRYEVEVRVRKHYRFWYESARIFINVTALLNGDVDLIQNGTTREDNYASNTQEVIHSISLLEPDASYATRNGTTLRTYWFLDCAYQGVTSGLTFPYNYTRGDMTDHILKALVVVSNETESLTPIGRPNVNITEEDIGGSNEVSATDGTTMIIDDVTIVKPSPPLLCPNESFIPFDPGKTYGYFYKVVSLRDPVSDVVVTGANWLMHGAVTNLSVTCHGSGPYDHCVKIMTGEYNVTGKESCVKPIRTTNCSIQLVHYFVKPKIYTFLFIISNSVSKTITRFGVNIYEVQKHAQLSVIMVPISCSLLAVILIVFGVAYHIQSRSRYTVEVADFDFSQTANDTEYKTFRERLRDAISSAMVNTARSQDDYGEDGGSTGGVWSPSRKYGSMQ